MDDLRNCSCWEPLFALLTLGPLKGGSDAAADVITRLPYPLWQVKVMPEAIEGLGGAFSTLLARLTSVSETLSPYAKRVQVTSREEKRGTPQGPRTGFPSCEFTRRPRRGALWCP